MPETTFPESAVHHALLNTGLIATYRHLEGRLTLAKLGSAVPDLAPEGVRGGYPASTVAYVMPEAEAALQRFAGQRRTLKGWFWSLVIWADGRPPDNALRHRKPASFRCAKG